MNQPIYAKNNPGFRIAYCANNQWRLQEHSNAKGSQTDDPWHNMSPALSKDEALQVLNRYHKDKAA
jgi:hypothetical protein